MKRQLNGLEPADAVLELIQDGILTDLPGAAAAQEAQRALDDSVLTVIPLDAGKSLAVEVRKLCLCLSEIALSWSVACNDALLALSVANWQFVFLIYACHEAVFSAAACLYITCYHACIA